MAIGDAVVCGGDAPVSHTGDSIVVGVTSPNPCVSCTDIVNPPDHPADVCGSSTSCRCYCGPAISNQDNTPECCECACPGRKGFPPRYGVQWSGGMLRGDRFEGPTHGDNRYFYTIADTALPTLTWCDDGLTIEVGVVGEQTDAMGVRTFGPTLLTGTVRLIEGGPGTLRVDRVCQDGEGNYLNPPKMRVQDFPIGALTLAPVVGPVVDPWGFDGVNSGEAAFDVITVSNTVGADDGIYDACGPDTIPLVGSPDNPTATQPDILGDPGQLDYWPACYTCGDPDRNPLEDCPGSPPIDYSVCGNIVITGYAIDPAYPDDHINFELHLAKTGACLWVSELDTVTIDMREYRFDASIFVDDNECDGNCVCKVPCYGIGSSKCFRLQFQAAGAFMVPNGTRSTAKCTQDCPAADLPEQTPLASDNNIDPSITIVMSMTYDTEPPCPQNYV